MQRGVVFPQTEIAPDPVAIRDFAQAAEQLGYDYLLAYEHVLGANPDRPGGWDGPYTHTDPFHEPFVLFGYLAGLTTRLEFATGVLILPQRHAVLVAKQAAALDVLSGGRLRLGVGVGWNPVEYEALGQDFTDRGQRIEEQIAVMRALWTTPLVTFHGEQHHISDAGLNPLPVQQPIPLWFGGMADVVLRRMARLGEGWMAPTMPAERAAPHLERLRGYLAEAGRDPDTFGIDVRVSSRMPPEHQAIFFKGWRKAGATHAAINTMNAGYTSVDEHIAALERARALF